MKKLIILIILGLSSSFVFCQEKKNQKIEPIGDLFEVTVYYEDGAIMQHGFMDKDHQLHASWESYYKNGNRKCVAVYNHGDKVGTWYYWFMDKKTKVVYENNEIVEVEEMDIE
ncbi:toxin-antitoxin system YwqK family antitoxin [Lutimonas sp.]|uniref:toxin-antitoxin system YwqK family antitoxin n=1 Tax=Lutimonas sp. TaxID=1872403 RepID=UPI003D9BD378